MFLFASEKHFISLILSIEKYIAKRSRKRTHRFLIKLMYHMMFPNLFNDPNKHYPSK